ncbi:hypothetical protein M514_28331, partial [Trichuris suis]
VDLTWVNHPLLNPPLETWESFQHRPREERRHHEKSRKKCGRERTRARTSKKTDTPDRKSRRRNHEKNGSTYFEKHL